MAWSLQVTKTVLRLIPIVYLLLGVYLVKNGRVIHDMAYPPNEENDIHTNDSDAMPEDYGNALSMTAKIVLAFQFAGLYLIIH